jgi:hypothetical protein
VPSGEWLGTAQTWRGKLSGTDLTYVAIGLSTYGFYVYAKPEIKEVRDLSGKILGVITKGASSDPASRNV